MNRSSYRQILPMLVVLASGTWTLGCESDGPEFATGEDTRVFEGRLLATEELDTSFFALTSSGSVNIQATTIVGTLPVTGVPIEDPSLGVSVGAPNPDNETECQLTFSQALAEGDSYSVYFRDGLYCISVFRVPDSPESAEFDYVVTLTGAFS